MNRIPLQWLTATMASVVAAAVAFASPPDLSEQGPERDGWQPEATLLNGAIQADWIAFRVAWGRIEAVMPREGSVVHESGDREGKETIGIVADPVGGTLEYSFASDEGELRLWVGRNGEIDLLWTPADRANDPEVRFVQPAARDEPLILSVGAGNGQRDYPAPTLWHLWIAHPDVVRRHLAPLLAVVMPRRHVEGRIAAIEAALLQEAARRNVPRHADWQACLHALADDRASHREAADAAIRAEGAAVLWFMEHSMPELEVEQQFRLQRIRRSLARSPPDATPASTARWLAGDPRLWSALAERPDARTQSLAQAALEQLTADEVTARPR